MNITGEGEGAIDWRSAYIALHSQVSGYLHGEDLEHWQRYNAEKFPLTKPEPKAGVVTEEQVERAALEAGGVGNRPVVTLVRRHLKDRSISDATYSEHSEGWDDAMAEVEDQLDKLGIAVKREEWRPLPDGPEGKG